VAKAACRRKKKVFTKPRDKAEKGTQGKEEPKSEARRMGEENDVAFPTKRRRQDPMNDWQLSAERRTLETFNASTKNPALEWSRNLVMQKATVREKKDRMNRETWAQVIIQSRHGTQNNKDTTSVWATGSRRRHYKQRGDAKRKPQRRNKSSTRGKRDARNHVRVWNSSRRKRGKSRSSLTPSAKLAQPKTARPECQGGGACKRTILTGGQGIT